jgi:peptidoglycan hydrolase-like protein with peptidoglycan-binding domain
MFSAAKASIRAPFFVPEPMRPAEKPAGFFHMQAKQTEDDRDPFGRVPPKPKPEPELTNLGDASKLSSPVGEQGKNDRRDVAKVETMLGRTGALDLKKTDGPTGYWGERTREATRAFQKQNGLKVDGDIGPKTTDAFRSALAENGPEKLTKSYTSMLGFYD